MPVQISTYDQVKAILVDGKYYIGRRKQYVFHCVEEIVTLRIKESVNTKQKYTLNGLKELESKVVLIRDHSSSVKKVVNSMTEGVLVTDHIPSFVNDPLPSKDIEKFLNVRFSSICDPV